MWSSLRAKTFGWCFIISAAGNVPVAVLCRVLDWYTAETAAWSAALFSLMPASLAAFVAPRVMASIVQRVDACLLQAGDGEHPNTPLPEPLKEFQPLVHSHGLRFLELGERLAALEQERSERTILLDSMIEGVVALAHDERVMLFSWAAYDLLGVPSSAEPVGRQFRDIVRNASVYSLLEGIWRDGNPVDAEIQLAAPAARVLQVYMTRLRGNGDTIGRVLMVFHDVTKMRRLEEMRKQFVANVSHELRTPVTSIKGFVETLLDGAHHDEGDRERFLGIIARHVDRLDAIFEDLLTLSRLEQDGEGSSVTLIPYVVADTLRSAVELCRPKALQSEVTVFCEAPPSLRALVNPNLLEQAVVNLLDNAIKYSSRGSRVQVRAVLEGESVRISVSDSGMGIPSSHLERIFERFYRIDAARSRKAGGTGLGLSIVKHIAQAHGGTASVKSQVGKGSEFSIVLRAAPGGKTADPERPGY
jgi:two-component system, OmpR family, phosphate regulon sensor histidine kinase PhoR